MNNTTENSRRPLETRNYLISKKLAQLCVSWGLTPNQMSLLGIVVTLIGVFFIFLATANGVSSTFQSIFLILAAICVQLRLLSNMLDGLMAVEEGKKSATGALFNEIPDRICDILFFVAAGIATEASGLGFLVAILAVFTAYIRHLGASLGFGHDFSGPMAKPHRMFALTVGLIAASFFGINFLYYALIIICLGTLFTITRRTINIANKLKGL